MIEVENVSFSYTKNENILNNVSLKIEQGDVINILGANGCGKSTFAIFLSLSIHIVILLYNKSENVIKENIVYFELVKQAANTDVSAVNEKITEEVEKVEENKK